MNTARQLIKNYEADIPTGGVRIYGYVKPLANGEAQYEVYAAANSRRKGNPLMTKCIYRMRTDKPDCYAIRDTIEYHSWCYLVHDHLIYDFHEKGGPTRKDYEKCVQGYTRGLWMKCRIEERKARSGHAERMLPLPMTMLNGFDGTKYQYCGYSPYDTGLPFADFLHLYNITPKVELLAKAGLRRLLTEDMCRFLEEHPHFGKWLAKHRREAKDGFWSPYRTKQEYAKTDPVALEEVRKAKREEAERRREHQRLEAERELRRRRKETKKYEKRIRALYEKVKDICATYGAYEVYVPQNAEEMIQEGVAMHNCIGQCYVSRQGDTSLCIFLRKNGKPCVDIEVSLKTFAVVQCRAVCNTNAPEAAWEVARQLAEMCRTRLAA